MQQTTPATHRRPAPTVRADVDAARRDLGDCTVSRFPHSADCYSARAEIEARISDLMRELVPEGVDARFVSDDAISCSDAEVLQDLLAAARWTADSADRSTYSGVCDGDSALDSIKVIERAMRTRGIPIPAWS